jgi:hypothetical protein
MTLRNAFIGRLSIDDRLATLTLDPETIDFNTGS